MTGRSRASRPASRRGGTAALSRRTGTRLVVTVALLGAALAPQSALGATGTATVVVDQAGSDAPVEDPTSVGGPVEPSERVGAAAALPVPRPPVAASGAPEDLARYIGQVACDAVVRPGTAALRAQMLATYGTGRDGGITRACSIGGRSEHKEGRAWDWMLNASDPAQRAVGDSYVAWLTGPDAAGVSAGNARRLGVMYVIWNRRIWSASSATWRAYTGAVPHTDHVHVSLSWDGAMRRTSWWTGKPIDGTDYGPCQPVVGQPFAAYTRRQSTPCPAPSEPRAPTPPASAATAVAGDWDGNGKDDVGWYSRGVFHLRASDGSTREFGFGRQGDVPVVGDWNGDGRDEVGVFRAGAWHLRNALSAGPASLSFGYGKAGDVPVVGRWSPGARLGAGVVRGSTWHLRESLSGGAPSLMPRLGRPGDLPVVGDWDGDGEVTPGVRRGNRWYTVDDARRMAVTNGFVYGASTMAPLVGDWDGDRRATAGVVKGSEFHLTDSTKGGAATSVVRFAL